MLQELIKFKKSEWLNSPECKVKSLVDYIKVKGELRDAQIDAIETYLYLKIKGENKPLWLLFCEGVFSMNEDLSKLHISQEAREIFQSNIAAKTLFEFSLWPTRN